nr:MAG: hypothetical protein [Bacteriophage sp.]
MRVNARCVAGFALRADKLTLGNGVTNVPNLRGKVSGSPGGAVGHPYFNHVSPRLITRGTAIPVLRHDHNARFGRVCFMVAVYRINAPMGTAIRVRGVACGYPDGGNIRNALFICQD